MERRARDGDGVQTASPNCKGGRDRRGWRQRWRLRWRLRSRTAPRLSGSGGWVDGAVVALRRRCDPSPPASAATSSTLHAGGQCGKWGEVAGEGGGRARPRTLPTGPTCMASDRRTGGRAGGRAACKRAPAPPPHATAWPKVPVVNASRREGGRTRGAEAGGGTRGAERGGRRAGRPPPWRRREAPPRRPLPRPTSRFGSSRSPCCMSTSGWVWHSEHATRPEGQPVGVRRAHAPPPPYGAEALVLWHPLPTPPRRERACDGLQTPWRWR